jgi:hypothetical protein
MTAAAFALDAVYSVYLIKKLAGFSSGAELPDGGFLTFSIAVGVFNIALLFYLAGYLFFAYRRNKAREAVFGDKR